MGEGGKTREPEENGNREREICTFRVAHSTSDFGPRARRIWAVVESRGGQARRRRKLRTGGRGGRSRGCSCMRVCDRLSRCLLALWFAGLGLHAEL